MPRRKSKARHAPNPKPNPLMSRLKRTLEKSKKDNPPVNFVLRPEILLCPNVPKPLHRLAPRNILGSGWWNKTRQEAYASTNFHCVACGAQKYEVKGSKKWLEGHEVYDIKYADGIATYIETVPLCPFCHNYIHDGRMRALLQKGELHHAKYIAVIQHGNQVLERAGLQKMGHNARTEELARLTKSGKIAKWQKWRLILFGKVYRTPYKHIGEWAKAHGIPPSPIRLIKASQTGLFNGLLSEEEFET